MTASIIGRFLLYSFSLSVAAYAVVAYALVPLGDLVHPDMKIVFLQYPIGIYLHVFASALALALGPFQFSTRLRRRFPKMHRWSGRLYLGIGVLLGGLAGLYMATHAFGGWPAKLGFAGSALVWLYTGTEAYRSALRGDFVSHRRWMIRNFSVTLAAVTLRIYLPASMISGIQFEVGYPFIAWLSWLPNLLIAEWWLRRTAVQVAPPITESEPA